MHLSYFIASLFFIISVIEVSSSTDTERIVEAFNSQVDGVVKILKDMENRNISTENGKKIYGKIMSQLAMIPSQEFLYESHKNESMMYTNAKVVSMAENIIKTELNHVQRMYKYSVEHQKYLSGENRTTPTIPLDVFISWIFYGPRRMPLQLSRMYNKVLELTEQDSDYPEPTIVPMLCDNITEILRETIVWKINKVDCNVHELFWTLEQLRADIVKAEIQGFLTMLHGYALRALKNNETFYKGIENLKKLFAERIASYNSEVLVDGSRLNIEYCYGGW